MESMRTVGALDAEGSCVAQKDGKEGVLYVENAHLWQVRNAYLYRLRIRIMDGEELMMSMSRKSESVP